MRAFVQHLQLHKPKVDLIPSHSIVCVSVSVCVYAAISAYCTQTHTVFISRN